MYSALNINGNSGCLIKMGLHLGRNDQKVNKQVKSDDSGGKEERSYAQGICKNNQI